MRYLLRLVTALALGADAYVHADLAGTYDAVTGTISQGNLFRLEAAAAALAAVLVIVLGNRPAWGWAILVGASALGAVLLYRYVDVGALGPLPNMYEPVWYPEKTASAVAEGVGTLAALAGFALGPGDALRLRLTSRAGRQP